jgi:hypothetical protein
MTDVSSFEDILKTPVSEIERPKPIPAGSYRCIIKQRPVFEKSARKQTPYVQFILNPLEAGEDVDADDLEAALTKGDGSTKVLSDVSIRATFYLTKDALWRLRKFLEDDLQIEDLADIGLEQGIDLAVNREVIAHIKHTPSDDGTAVYANLAGTAPVEE